MAWIISIYFMIYSYTVSNVYGEDYNLIGVAGQAYAIEINIGTPPQKLSVLVDTGSTTLAIASYPRHEDNLYFHLENSTTIYKSGKEVQAKYSQGMWVGDLISDSVNFPSLPSIPEVRSDIALITKSHNFFMNGSGWQGLLGLAYLPVGAWGDDVVVESWLDSVDRSMKRPMSFQLKLCGPTSAMNAYGNVHYGKFDVLDDHFANKNLNTTYRTPILRKSWYEVGVLSIRLINPLKNLVQSNHTLKINTTKNTNDSEINEDVCQKLNLEKSIVDSGTTNIRLPDELFTNIVDELRNIARNANMLILDEFWYHGEAACWPEPQQWSLPWLAIDLLSDEADDQYFTLEIPSQNYMRLVSAHNSSIESGNVSVFCYKLGLEAGGKETVLGYTAMEGLQVLFNRSSGWIGFQTSNCGPEVKITGPYNTSQSLVTLCKLTTPIPEVAVSIKTAQWALCAISIIAAGVLIYLLAPCIKMLVKSPLGANQQISLSQAALFEQETT